MEINSDVNFGVAGFRESVGSGKMGTRMFYNTCCCHCFLCSSSGGCRKGETKFSDFHHSYIFQLSVKFLSWAADLLPSTWKRHLWYSTPVFPPWFACPIIYRLTWVRCIWVLFSVLLIFHFFLPFNYPSLPPWPITHRGPFHPFRLG